jgi:hypothetical protein
VYPVLVPIRLCGAADGYHDRDGYSIRKQFFHGFAFDFAFISFRPPLLSLDLGDRESRNKIEGVY